MHAMIYTAYDRQPLAVAKGANPPSRSLPQTSDSAIADSMGNLRTHDRIKATLFPFAAAHALQFRDLVLPSWAECMYA